MHESFVRFATEDDALATGAAKGPRIGADGAELLVRHEVRLEVLVGGRGAVSETEGFCTSAGLAQSPFAATCQWSRRELRFTCLKDFAFICKDCLQADRKSVV